MEQTIRIGRHLIAPAIAVYLFHISTWATPMSEKYALTGAVLLLFLGIAYGVAWIHSSWK